MQKNVQLLVIAVLLIVIVLQRCNGGNKPVPAKPVILVKTDTSWQIRDSIVVKKGRLVYRDTSYKVKEKQFIPDSNCAVLRRQFELLVKTHTEKNSYADSILIGDYGYVLAVDTVQFNKLGTKSYQYHYKIPIITTTVTIEQPLAKARQLYIGGGIAANKFNGLTSLSAGLLYKNKKDQLYGAFVNSNVNAQLSYGLQLYWKISTKK